jgi:hypothetical protein
LLMLCTRDIKKIISHSKSSSYLGGSLTCQWKKKVIFQNFLSKYVCKIKLKMHGN